MQALNVAEKGRRSSHSPHDPSRTGSAPPGFDSSYLFSYVEGDFYTRSFAKGPFLSSSPRSGSPAQPRRGYSPLKEFKERYLSKGLELRKLSTISSSDDDSSSLASPTLLSKNVFPL